MVIPNANPRDPGSERSGTVGQSGAVDDGSFSSGN